MSESTSKQTTTGSATRLVDILRALPIGELESLAHRVGAPLDRSKRVDIPTQLSRALASLPELRDPVRLGTTSVQLLRRITEAGGTLVVRSLPQGLEALVGRGIVFARVKADGRFELVLPSAHVVQLPPWEGEDPRGLRVLLAQAASETWSAMAAHYTGKPAMAPLALQMEAAWEALRTHEGVVAEVEQLPPAERRLLASIEQVGGEVDTEELLDLEREPLRLHRATGATPSRRGVGFSLERRGMLIPVHPNRHVIPTEVAAVIGAWDATIRERKRAQIRAFVLDGEHEPRRARFAADPVPMVIALAMAMREWGSEPREGVGTPRSLVVRLAQRFGREAEGVGLLCSLSRAIGLWDSASLSRTLPPGSLTVAELGPVLFSVWRKGGVWDEARPEPEVLRVPADSRETGPIAVVRDIVLDALEDLGEGHWVPFEALADYVREDARTAGVARLLKRWADRVGVEAPTPTEVAQRIVLESLPVLGVVDLGEADSDDDAGGDAGPLVRITRRGRALLAGAASSGPSDASAFVDDSTLRIGEQSLVASVIALYPTVEVGKVTDHLELVVTPASLTRAVSEGVEADAIRASLQTLAPPSDTVSKLLDQMTVIIGRATFVGAAGFIWCEDADIREMLRTRRQTSDLFVDPSPPGGLLVAPGKNMETIARKCRALGVELMVDGQVVRSRSTMPPALADSSPPARSSSVPARVAKATRRRSKYPPPG